MSRTRSDQGLVPFRHTKAPPPPEMTSPLVLVESGTEGDLSQHLRMYAIDELVTYLGAEVVTTEDLADRTPRIVYVPGPGTEALRRIRHTYPVSAVVYFGDLRPSDIPEAVNAGANSLLPLQSLNAHMVYLSAIEAMQRAEVYHASVDIRSTELVFTDKKKGSPEVMGLATAARDLAERVDSLLVRGEQPSVSALARLEAAKAAVQLAVAKVGDGEVDLRDAAESRVRRLRAGVAPTLDEARQTIRATAMFKTGLG